MEISNKKLKEEFYNDCGIDWKNQDGEPDIDYVIWLENMRNFEEVTK